MGNRGSIVLAIAVTAIWLAGCSESESIEKERESGRKMEAWCLQQGLTEEGFLAENMPKGEAYRNPGGEEILRRYNELSEGMPSEQVRDILGPPSFVMALPDKERTAFTCDWIYALSGVRDEFGFDETGDGDLVSVYFQEPGKVAGFFRKKVE